jgi:pyruvate dehydrogenase (quinone)
MSSIFDADNSGSSAGRRSELAMPPAVTAEMAKGFTLYPVQAVMSGRRDDLLDLARTNLWR